MCVFELLLISLYHLKIYRAKFMCMFTYMVHDICHLRCDALKRFGRTHEFVRKLGWHTGKGRSIDWRLVCGRKYNSEIAVEYIDCICEIVLRVCLCKSFMNTLIHSHPIVCNWHFPQVEFAQGVIIVGLWYRRRRRSTQFACSKHTHTIR